MTKPPIAPAKVKAKRGDAKETIGDVTVERDDDMVHVTWVTSCARRTFTPKELRDVLSQFEIIAALGGEDVWLESADHNGSYFAALIKDGRVYGTDNIKDPAGVDNAPWPTVKKALIARARQGKPEQE